MELDLRTKASVDAGVTSTDANETYTRAYEYQPGNGTRYVLVVTDLGRLHSFTRDQYGEGEVFLVSWVNESGGKSMVFHKNTLLYPTYVMEKLQCGISDAAVIAELLGQKLGVAHLSCEEVQRTFKAM